MLPWFWIILRQTVKCCYIYLWQTMATIASLLRSYERAMGLLCCFRPTSHVWYEPEPAVRGRITLHVSPFCDPERAARMPLCKADDANCLHDKFALPGPPLVRTCHAGADEIIIPVHWQNQLVLVVFFGQFRRSETQPASLPLWPQARVRHALNLATSLQSHLLTLYHKRRARLPGPTDPRLVRVTEWLISRLGDDPTLEDLAEFLCVSPTWASHLIRQLSGQSFTQLKDEIRLKRAEHLLATTTIKISTIARQMGMQDANYFSRFFRAQAGMTATEYRKIHQLPQQI